MSQNDTTEARKNQTFDLSIFRDITTVSNKAFLVGTLSGKFEHNYTSSATNEKYYKAIIAVPRKSGREDHVRVLVPERLIICDLEKFIRGVCVKVSGALCSHLHSEERNKKRLRLFVLAEKIELYPHEETPEFNNCIYLEGKIHKPPFTRKAVIADKLITDVFLTVRRDDKKMDYITCLTWGSSARMVSELNVGDEIVVKGRLQSRMYFERYKRNPEIGAKREVHEVSVFEIVSIAENEEE